MVIVPAPPAAVLLRRGRLSERRPVGDEAYADGDEDDSRPALERDCFVKPEAGEEGHDDVAECRGWEDKGEVCPGKRSEIAGEKAENSAMPMAIQGVKTAAIRVPDERA